MAIRPKTLTASLAPVGVGTGLAFGMGEGRWLPALAALGVALLIQIGTNLTNDYYDFKKGADTAERLGPMRVTQRGLIAPGKVLAGALGCFAVAILAGIYLVAVGGWPVVAIGLSSVLFGYAYTGGPFPLAYHGLGDVFVFIYFGLVAVTGTYYVQALTVCPAAWWAAIPVGALGTALLAVNNLRDVQTDAKAGKRTLVVRLGTAGGKAEYALMLAVAYATPFVMFGLGLASAWVFLALLSAPFAVGPARLVFRAQGSALNSALAATARLLLVFGLLFAVGLWLR
ncbi:1,4-dihydroxy-2-naphthoate prenyltransferase [Stigmatella erecta]|uniref:1,4-dihydroxy-2-naphthoate octaprenyltransferase n=2 Tax=Stigmatella erecta TaxID=83460 RepID=A0A1I0ALQ9_9BACT|nr:1,4-dihydroxy-2-naphthoate prenyltransferase [Stigmatella erecta]